MCVYVVQSEKMAHLPIFLLLFFSAFQCRLCENSSPAPDDFYILSQDTGISRYQLSSAVLVQLPVLNLKAARAIEYDVRNDCVFWTDSKRVVRQCLTNNQPIEVLVSNGIDNVVDLAYDWKSETLYFVDAGRHKIEAVETSQRVLLSSSGQNNWRRTVVELGPQTTSTSIAVHPTHGYLFWTQYGLGNTQNSSIVRTNLDGSVPKQLHWHPKVMRPVDITVDHEKLRIYWIDRDGNFIAGSLITGHGYRVYVHLNGDREHPNRALSARKGIVYWSGSNGQIFASDVSTHGHLSLTHSNTARELKDVVVADDFKVYNKQNQSTVNYCSTGRHNCSHICVGTMSNSFKCMCPDALVEETAADGRIRCTCAYGDEQECYTRLYACQPTEFQCVTDSKCISS